jgi:hypothetical protein
MSEKVGGNVGKRHLMEPFCQTLEAYGLTDLGFIGPKFTWTNCQEGNSLIKERLDRGVCNMAWRNLFPESQISVEAAISSDHTPLLLYLEGSRVKARQSTRFHYDACWASDKGCQETIKNSWLQENRPFMDWDTLSAKLAACVENMRIWRREKNKNTQGSILKLQRRLLLLQTRGNVSDVAEIKKVQIELHGLLDKEELWWRQRAKEEWLKYGDRNTKYFHTCANSK